MWKENKMYCVLQFGTIFFTMSRRRVIEHTATKNLSPMDVDEFRTVILEARTRLASLLTVEYFSADLVSDALYNVRRLWRCTACRGNG